MGGYLQEITTIFSFTVKSKAATGLGPEIDRIVVNRQKGCAANGAHGRKVASPAREISTRTKILDDPFALKLILNDYIL